MRQEEFVRPAAPPALRHGSQRWPHLSGSRRDQQNECLTLSAAHQSSGGRQWTTVLRGVEALALSLQPFAVGLAIDSLAAGRYRGLAILTAQSIFYALLGALRRSKPHGGAVRDAMERWIGEVTCAAAATAMLGWYDLRLLPILLLFAIPALLLEMAESRRRALRSAFLADRAADDIERSRGGDQLGSLAQAATADRCAFSFGLRQLFMAGTLAVALVYYTAGSEIHPGESFAVISYLLLFMRHWPPAASRL
jgi:hypothetical protein